LSGRDLGSTGVNGTKNNPDTSILNKRLDAKHARLNLRGPCVRYRAILAASKNLARHKMRTEFQVLEARFQVLAITGYSTLT